MPTAVALQLRRLRQTARLTRGEVAGRLGVQPEAIEALELADRPPSLCLVTGYLGAVGASRRTRSRVLGDVAYERLLAPCREYDPRALDRLGQALDEALREMTPR